MVSRFASLLATARRRRPDARSLARRVHADEGGAIAITFALMLVGLCLFVGAAVDFGRWLQAHQQTRAAMDAATLAGARVLLQLDNNDVDGALKAANDYYTENTKGRVALVDDTPSFRPTQNNKAFAGESSAYLKTAFLSFAGVTQLPVRVSAEVALPAKPLEISMMLDVTGSMEGSKMRDLKLAAQDLVEIVIPASTAEKKVRVALVPFSEGVRLPQSAWSKARGSPASSITLSYRSGRNTLSETYYRTDCVVERTGGNKYTDAAPGPGNYVLTLYKAKDSRGNTVPCDLSANEELVPLTDDKAVLETKISKLGTKGMTAGHTGTAWAWYTLSPSWNSLWPSASAAAPYGSDTQKIAILMTDGEYNREYDANGVLPGSKGAGSAANGTSTNQARALCTAMKAKGITVYTVGFALGKSSSAIQTLNHCASDPSMAYTPENGTELKDAFRDIAFKISQLYLTH
jgi:Flp pilus assembly protein TadG